MLYLHTVKNKKHMQVKYNLGHKIKSILMPFFLLLVMLFVSGNTYNLNSESSKNYFKEELKTINNTQYLIITPSKAHIDFEITRPSKNDQNTLLCVAGAYTSLKTGAVDGLYICKGKLFNKKLINQTLDGGVKITANKVEIFSSNKGQILTDSFLKKITDQNGIFFQQSLCINNGMAINLNDSKLFQRRGIISLKTGGYAIVESKKAISLNAFSKDMIGIGANSLLNFDMGAWDEGWYRNAASNKLIVLGKNKSQTSKQSNWIVLRK
jgi:hypothetical protein